jgi:predicted nucleotidyltransferase component of viral defense system
MGRSYYLGHDKDNLIKLDVYYTTDPFVWPALKKRGLRLASTEEIIAMKLDVISRNGRKKDFWDIHELIGDYSLGEMLAFHEKRYPDTHDTAEITKKLRDFSKANYDFDPDCLRGKYWELIQLDLIDFIEKGM